MLTYFLDLVAHVRENRYLIGAVEIRRQDDRRNYPRPFSELIWRAKSLFRNILPISPSASRFCGEDFAKSFNFNILRTEGRGGTPRYRWYRPGASPDRVDREHP